MGGGPGEGRGREVVGKGGGGESGEEMGSEGGRGGGGGGGRGEPRLFVPPSVRSVTAGGGGRV